MTPKLPKPDESVIAEVLDHRGKLVPCRSQKEIDAVVRKREKNGVVIGQADPGDAERPPEDTANFGDVLEPR